jgi:hypothetical protein
LVVKFIESVAYLVIGAQVYKLDLGTQ